MTKQYTHKEKRNRNQRLYEFWLKHRDWRIESIAKVFHISQPRASKILKDYTGKCKRCGGNLLKNYNEVTCLQCGAEHDINGNLKELQ